MPPTDHRMCTERFEQIAGNDAATIARAVIVYEPINLAQQYSSIKELDKIINENVGLVVLDSATTFYRLALKNSGKIALRGGLYERWD